MLHNEIRNAVRLTDEKLRAEALTSAGWQQFLTVMNDLADQVEQIENNGTPLDVNRLAKVTIFTPPANLNKAS